MYKITQELRKFKQLEKSKEKHSSKKEIKEYYSLTNYIFEIVDEIILLVINISLISSIVIALLTTLNFLIKTVIIFGIIIFLLFSILLMIGVSIDLYRIHSHYEMKKILDFKD